MDLSITFAVGVNYVGNTAFNVTRCYSMCWYSHYNIDYIQLHGTGIGIHDIKIIKDNIVLSDGVMVVKILLSKLHLFFIEPEHC